MVLRIKFYGLTLIVLAAICLSSAANADLRSLTREKTSCLKDISLTARVVNANKDELRKISKDFPKSYEFKTSTISFKCPDKMKMEGKLGMVHGSITINGDWKITRFIVKQKENIKNEPHKRQSEFDIGIFTDSIWSDYIVKDTDLQKGSSGNVYRVTFVRSNSRERKIACWVDADTLKLQKVEKYNSDGSLKARYIYSCHSHINGIWVPGRVDVYNCDGKLAGATEYENIRVNAGIPDSEFK